MKVFTGDGRLPIINTSITPSHQPTTLAQSLARVTATINTQHTAEYVRYIHGLIFVQSLVFVKLV